MPVTPDQIEQAGSYLDLWLGGGAASVIVSIYGYHRFYILPKAQELMKQIQSVQGYIKHERDERKKLDPRFEQLQTEIHAEKAGFVEFMNWYDAFKQSTNNQIKNLEETERTHYQEMRDMKAEDKLIRQELSFVKDKVNDIEISVGSIKNSIEELKTLFMQEALSRRAAH